MFTVHALNHHTMERYDDKEGTSLQRQIWQRKMENREGCVQKKKCYYFKVTLINSTCLTDVIDNLDNTLMMIKCVFKIQYQ